jgi:uncharacterized protein (DUF305 family)
MRSTARIVAAVAAPLALAALLTACGGSSTAEHAGHGSATPTTNSEHNADDVMFAQMMIPHHQQALDMAAMVPSHTTNQDIILLAVHINQDQKPEILAFQSWLQRWGEPIGHGHGHGMPIDGMVDAATMNQLQSLRGPDFDKLWMQSMISHHRGAIAMAQQEIAHGRNPDAISRAKLIVSTQQREIDYMKHLMGTTQ